MIDLREVYGKYPQCFSSYAKLNSLLRDLYPLNRREVNLIMAAYECGIPNRLKSVHELDSLLYHSLAKAMHEEYGIEMNACENCIISWANSFGLTISLNRIEKEPPSSTKLYDNDNMNKQKPQAIVLRDYTVQESDTKEYLVADNYQITIDTNGEVVIQRYVGFPDTDTLLIPALIQGKKVKGVASGAFQNIDFLHKIVIENGIEYIDNHAFFESSIEEITIPSSVEFIGESCFEGCKNLRFASLSGNCDIISKRLFYRCSNLKEIIIPYGIKTVSKYAFKGCKSLCDVTLIEGLKKIELWAFHGCPSLCYLSIPDSVEIIEDNIFEDKKDITINCSTNGIAYRYAHKHGYQVTNISEIDYAYDYSIINEKEVSITRYKGDCERTVIVPHKIKNRTVVCLGESSFAGVQGIERVVLPEGIISIETKAFANCSIERVELPNSVKRIGDLAFSHCNALNQITFSQNLLIIPNKAFWSCTSLKSVKIPASVLKIDHEAFSGCTDLINIEMNSNLIEMGASVFRGCKKLQTLLLPKSLTRIGVDILGYESDHVTVLCYYDSIAYRYARTNSYRVQNAALWR